jgi:cytochrome c553
MRAFLRGAVAVAAAALFAPFPHDSAHAADAAAGREKAVLCQTCHGMDGLSKLPDAPHIAGQPESYLVKALTEFKTGVRKNEMMSVVVAMMTADDIRNVAAYYSAIEITVKPPK